jgi:hypothetical protein
MGLPSWIRPWINFDQKCLANSYLFRKSRRLLTGFLALRAATAHQEPNRSTEFGFFLEAGSLQSFTFNEMRTAFLVISIAMTFSVHIASAKDLLEPIEKERAEKAERFQQSVSEKNSLQWFKPECDGSNPDNYWIRRIMLLDPVALANAEAEFGLFRVMNDRLGNNPSQTGTAVTCTMAVPQRSAPGGLHGPDLDFITGNCMRSYIEIRRILAYKYNQQLIGHAKFPPEWQCRLIKQHQYETAPEQRR